MPSSTRTTRRQAIVDLLTDKTVRNQAHLQELLAKRGFHVNQATLSRDLRDLSVVKGQGGYALAGNGASHDPAAELARTVGVWLESTTTAENLLVLRTPPSGAQPLAFALDAADLDGVLGTIAGDDTILVICSTPTRAKRVARDLERFRQ